MTIGPIRVRISECAENIYLRWWWNGFHYFNFINGYTIQMKTTNMGIQVTNLFSVISKIERPTRIKSEYSYAVTLEGIDIMNLEGFTGLLMAEKVMQYELGTWREVDVTRGEHLLRDINAPGYRLDFTITRKEIPNSSSTFQKSLKLYLGDILCDLDDDEVVPINKQTNNIAEMQDRQSDFTATFKIRKTREMKALFELSGETGINTNFPYENKSCKLISDGIEIITDGAIILDKVDDQYYYVAILSGNKNFFRVIETAKLTDLTIASIDHTWDVATMVGTHAADLDYVYPLCEPSDDGSIIPLTDDGTRCTMYGGWIWPFVKVKAMWDRIFTEAGFTYSGDMFTTDAFPKLFMPIISRTAPLSATSAYLYSNLKSENIARAAARTMVYSFTTYILTDDDFKIGRYYAPYSGTYRFRVQSFLNIWAATPSMWINVNAVEIAEMTLMGTAGFYVTREYELTLVANDLVQWTIGAGHSYGFIISVISIDDPAIGYGSTVTLVNYLPTMTQQEFIKNICNLFGLIPETNPRTRNVFFWNYNLLYDNIPNARDWSTYLSERDDEMEFKFGDYAQENRMRYKESDDVIVDNGMGILAVEDETLPAEKDVIELSIATCDEVTVLTDTFSVDVSRINFNTWNADTGLYDANKEIDARIVYVDRTTALSPYEKVMGLRTAVSPVSPTTDINSPKKASSFEVSFPVQMYNYAGLSRMLTKCNLRRAKFNLPVYEVAGLHHYIPIYLSQYKAYFYVNKINNYVPGKLCTIDLIKL